jgi:Tfp pilus assembly protein PilV
MSGPDPTLRNPRDGRRRLLAAARAEDGIMLVELLMAALLVALISIGVFTAIVGSSRGSANDRHRSIAAALAQQDQERMRAFKATDLANYRQTRPVTVAGTTYSVESRGQWVSDASGVISCSSVSSAANYLHITSTVTWPSIGGLKPIAVRSLVAPPSGSTAANTGTLSVRLTNQAATGIPGISLALGSPANLGDTTDSSGCAVFPGVTAGNYTLSFSQPGYVDVGGNGSISKTVSVTGSSTTTENIEYAQAGAIAVSFDTKVGANPVQATTSEAVTVSHANMPAPGRRTFDPAGGPVSTINATSLFPFTSGYNVYAGSCANNDPSVYNSNYYTTAGNQGSVTVAPGGSYAVAVRKPAINIRTERNGTNYAGADVLVKLTSSGCTETFPNQTSNSSFALPQPDFPFGTYQVCADAMVTATSWPFATTKRKRTVTGIANTGPAGTATVEVDITSSVSSSSGDCS